MVVYRRALRKDDTLTVWKLDRLGRDLHHLINMMHDLIAREVGLKVLARHGADTGTTNPAGKLCSAFLPRWLSSRELISERTVAGLASARSEDAAAGCC